MTRGVKQTPESFWAQIKKTDGCWEWQGCKNIRGYGSVRWHGEMRPAHRVAAWLGGLLDTHETPASKQADTFVLHKCDNPPCCNPEHLFIGTLKENMQDAYAKNRRVHPKGADNACAKLTRAQAEEIQKEYAKGVRTQQDIAQQYGVNSVTVHKIVQGKRYIYLNDRPSYPKKYNRGEKHHNAVLTDAHAVAIREAYAKGNHTHRSLALEYGIGETTVWRVLTGGSYKSINK